MQDLIIREARNGDLKTIQELNHQLFLHEEKYDPSLEINWSFEEDGENYFKDRINGKEGVCFVAEFDNKIVGYLAGGLTRTYPFRKIKKMTELENTLVKEEFRGQGIGEKLFKKFLDWSKSMSVERIKVKAYTSNSRGIKFYERIGFIHSETELEYEVK